MLIDVDGLKQVNDERGHEAGDQVLRATAGAIRHTLRETDFGARWGGDEFAIIAPKTADRAATRLADRLLHQIGGRARTSDAQVTASGGLSIFDPNRPEPGADWESLVRGADAALYPAKAGGRNQVRVA